tara:strand:- start:645 stop:845 length:201 start_codon:yes stop_codon:yes gene_type:complete
MQKVVNTLSIISFTAFLVGLGGLGYGWFNRQKLIDHALNEIKSELPNLVKDIGPKLPTSTGPALPF